MTSPRPVLTLIGGPTAILEYGGIRLLTDPTFDEPGDYPSGAVTLHKLTGPALAVDEVGEIDVVLLSHDQHPDNLDAAGRAFLPRAAAVLSTPAASARIPGVHGLEPWQTRTVGDVEVTAVPALHGPDGAEELSDSLDWDIFPEAVAAHGELPYDQSFIFVPLLSLGGAAKVENLHKRETIASIQVAVDLQGVIGH